MDRQYPPPPPRGIFSGEESYKIAMAAYTCVTAFILLLTFFTVITRFRLWHRCSILEKIPKLVEDPVTWLISQCLTFVLAVKYGNDLYFIWLMVLIIAYDNVLTISSGHAPSSVWLLREYVYLFYYIYLGVLIIKNKGDKEYYIPLLVLWSLLLAKFSIWLVCDKLVKRAYGRSNTKLVADYMKIEHILPNPIIDPRSMKGYKYLVMGEGKIDPNITGPEYTAEIDLADVVTVERVWSCNERLLHPSIDVDNRLKHVCLSFAFFKLLKRRFFGYPAAEARQEKTRQLVFDGLLSWDDNESVYSVIKMEIGFVRDFFYTRYPVIFALGFPVIHVIVLTGMLGVSLWISVLAFYRREDPSNMDYTITNALLIILVMMEALETMSYVFSDWTRVILICRHVRSLKLHGQNFFDKVLALLCKGKFSRSLNNKIGQFSLLENYNRKTCPDWLRVNCFPYSTWGWSPLEVAPRGMKKDKAVVLSPDVKEAILGSLRMVNGYPTKGVASLQRNGVSGDLAWTCSLKTELHIIMVWHIATSLCGIRPVREGGSIELIRPHHLVASHLSNYCAYLVVFLPEMLPDSIFSVKLLFREILSETKEFFEEARSSEHKYVSMMQFEGVGNLVVDQGVRLGKHLMQQIPDDTRRWKIMADFWSEFILFLAPSGKVREHLRQLESGGEFITHLWALLYHAGIVDTTIPDQSIP